jgi:hypothetical protein
MIETMSMPVFIAPLFTIAKLWNQPSLDALHPVYGFKKKTQKQLREVYIHNGVLLSHKKNKMIAFTGKQMKLEIVFSKIARFIRTRSMCSPSCGI